MWTLKIHLPYASIPFKCFPMHSYALSLYMLLYTFICFLTPSYAFIRFFTLSYTFIGFHMHSHAFIRFTMHLYVFIRLHTPTYAYIRLYTLWFAFMHFYMHAKVTEFANLLHYEFVGTTTRDPASLSNRLYPAEAGKKDSISSNTTIPLLRTSE